MSLLLNALKCVFTADLIYQGVIYIMLVTASPSYLDVERMTAFGNGSERYP